MGIFKNRNPGAELNEAEKRFRRMYEETHHVVQSAKAAGRGMKWGYRQMIMPYMADLVVKEKAEIQANFEESLKTAEGRKAWLERVISGDETSEQAIVTESGVEIVDISFPPATRVKAMDQLQKACGDYAPQRIELTEGSVTFVQVLNSRGPLPPGVEAQSLPRASQEPEYVQCEKCQEAIEQSFYQKHVDSCPGL